MTLSTRVGPTHVVAAGEDADQRRRTPCVVVVPGTNFNAATSLPLITALAARWPTYAVDVPGQPGLSAPERPGPNRPTLYGRWLEDVLDAVGTGPTVVVGHSLGGAIALACEAPRLSGRLLVSPAGLARLKVTGRVLAATVPWLICPTNTRSATLLRQMHGPGHGPSAGHVEWMTLVARSCHSSLAPFPLPKGTLARSRRVANLVVAGEQDVFLPPSRLTSPASRHLGVAVITVPGAGHLVVEEEPAAMVALTAAFMNGDEGSGR
ncbi:alpha/beta fold hydrolase [Streptomyces sp. CB02400]|uniref:alpha/beta fold hydrolase n=1 Tax=unclassified Streptomyces TaxID=2593676 RepID=UPI001F31AFE0|nr:alpha/beta hydrolase [Streptomyces sp. CB02400]